MADKYLDERIYEPGDVIFTEGDASSEMFIVQEGKVVIMKTVAGRDLFLAALDRGEFFGEMGLLESRPRQATCHALLRTRLVAIKSGELLIKLRRDPTLALEMLQTMSKRMRYMNTQLAELMENEMLSRQNLEKVVAKSEFGRRESAK
jgi:CRP/FNR family cyclic AMP-dependent transcriptional regulator